MENGSHLFTSERLGFRNWVEADIDNMYAINNDPAVMEFFPALPTYEQTSTFITNMQKEYAEKGYCYFAVDELATGTFIGFIGLLYRTYESEFTPCIDIGWRLGHQHWYKGYATEGAKRCLRYAFEALQLQRVVATAPQINTRSVNVMQKIGMTKDRLFQHRALKDHPCIVTCVLYAITP